MKHKYKVDFSRKVSGSVVVEAESSEDAKRVFLGKSLDELIDAWDDPGDIEIENVRDMDGVVHFAAALYVEGDPIKKIFCGEAEKTGGNTYSVNIDGRVETVAADDAFPAPLRIDSGVVFLAHDRRDAVSALIAFDASRADRKN